ncbi:MAG: hypothetical protein LBE91_20325 [Tannerella sp.]|nr:hypothetical protein [Tannerella sp.]
MPLTNLNNLHLSASQLSAAQSALTQLETALSVVNVNLTAEDRRRYGSINEQHKLFVNKIGTTVRTSSRYVRQRLTGGNLRWTTRAASNTNCS